ncbi:MAG: hypothetical protein U0T69_14300 [Chitinophagales bacterium]
MKKSKTKGIDILVVSSKLFTEQQTDDFADAFLEHIETHQVFFGGGFLESKIEGSIYSEVKSVKEMKKIILDYFSEKDCTIDFIATYE